MINDEKEWLEKMADLEDEYGVTVAPDSPRQDAKQRTFGWSDKMSKVIEYEVEKLNLTDAKQDVVIGAMWRIADSAIDIHLVEPAK